MSKPIGARFSAAIVATALVGALLGHWLYRAYYQPESPPSAARSSPNAAPDLIGKRRPDFILPDLSGKLQDVSQWDGKVVLVNFWATWCPPCRREIPAFIELQDQYREHGLQIVGVAIDEPEVVRQFADTVGVNYPMLNGTLKATQLARAFGNSYGALPYSVLVDRHGVIRYVRPGELTRGRLVEQLKPLL